MSRVWAYSIGGMSIPLQGAASIASGEAYMTTRILAGYYTTYIAGGLCIALALLRNIIVGKHKSDNSITIADTV